MGLVGVKWFVSPSVPAVATRRVDRLEFLEIEVGDCLELVDQSRSFEAVWQVVRARRGIRPAERSAPLPLLPSVWAVAGAAAPARRGVGRSVGAAWHGVAPAA